MNRHISENDEFLLSRLLDGDLPAEEAAVLRRRMEREPELRAAYDSLVRVDGSLKRRRADQPAVDWRKFHERVIDAVWADRAIPPRMIPITRWLGVGTPLAAAAAIVLILCVYPQFLTGPKPDVSVPGSPVVTDTIADRERGGLTVRVHRPSLDRGDAAEPPRVVFGRSPELERVLEISAEEKRNALPSIVAVGRPKLPEVELPLEIAL